MKFGQCIEQIARKDKKYGHQFLQYKILKKFIKHGLSQSNEAEFIQMLDNEIQRIKTTVTSKISEMKLGGATLYLATQTSQGEEAENLVRIKSAADDIGTELAALERFMYYNNEGLRKIVKKHDRWSGINSFWFEAQRKSKFLIEARQELELVMIQLSDIYHYIRQKEIETNVNGAETPDAGIEQETFERTSTKYWISTEDVFTLKIMIIKHLPVNIFQRSSPENNAKSLDQRNPSILLKSHEDLTDDISNLRNIGWISSVYFDNDKLDCFHNRINMEEGAQLIRIRWYGDPNEPNRENLTFLPRPPLKGLFFERKTHHESWVEEKSKKERFNLDENEILPFLQGNETVCHRKAAKQDQLAYKIQEKVTKSNLDPKIRTIYKRTAFQFDFNNDVRITLDTELKFVDETKNKRENSWRRSEAEIASEQDWINFHSAILEVKLRTASPKWLEEILSQPMVKQCHKFSKYQHGVAIFHAEKAKMLPYWLDDVEMQEALHRKKNGDTDYTGRASSCDFVSSDTVSVNEMTVIPMEELKSDQQKVAICDPGDKGIARKRLNNGTKALKKAKPRATRRVKIEPKTFFANERTFIQWLTAAILILTASAALIDLGDANTQITGLLFMPLGLVILLYAIIVFYVRLHAIKSGRMQRYDDCFGPSVLVLMLIGALGATTYMYFSRNVGRLFPGFDPKIESPRCHQLNVSNLPLFYEPSDLAMPTHDSQFMWTCNLNMLSKIDLKRGHVIETVRIKDPKPLDCESLFFLPSRPDVIYVGTEENGNQILEFDLKLQKVLRIIDLAVLITNDPLVEGLAFYQGYVDSAPAPETEVLGNGTFFVSGVGFVKAFFIEEKNTTVIPHFKITIPIEFNSAGTAKIGALTVHENILYAVLDNERILLGWNLVNGSFFSHPLPGTTKQWEGIAVTESSSKLKKYVYLAHDHPAQVWRFNFDSMNGFEAC